MKPERLSALMSLYSNTVLHGAPAHHVTGYIVFEFDPGVPGLAPVCGIGHASGGRINGTDTAGIARWMPLPDPTDAAQDAARRYDAEDELASARRRVGELETTVAAEIEDRRRAEIDCANALVHVRDLQMARDSAIAERLDLGAKLADVQREIFALKAERELAADELKIPMPEPGTDMSRLLAANVLLRRQLADAREEAKDATEELAPRLETLRNTRDALFTSGVIRNPGENLPDYAKRVADIAAGAVVAESVADEMRAAVRRVLDIARESTLEVLRQDIIDHVQAVMAEDED